MPDHKQRRGYRHVAAKSACAGLSPLPSETVRVPHIAAIEMRIQRMHLGDSILLDGDPGRADPNTWRPLVMRFLPYYGAGPRLHPSALAEIAESLYRGPDIDRARSIGQA